MNPYLIEHVARERLDAYRGRAELDALLREARRAAPRIPRRPLPPSAPPAPAPCCA